MQKEGQMREGGCCPQQAKGSLGVGEDHRSLFDFLWLSRSCERRRALGSPSCHGGGKRSQSSCSPHSPGTRDMLGTAEYQIANPDQDPQAARRQPELEPSPPSQLGSPGVTQQQLD